MKRFISYGFFSLLLMAISACNPLKKIPDGKYFLNRNVVRSDSLKTDKEEVFSIIKQKPNRKILGLFRFHLGIYHLGNTGDTSVESHKGLSKFWKKIKRGMRNIGEEPVILDTILTEKSRKQLEIYLFQKGYFNVRVTDSVDILKGKKKKVNVIYTLKAGMPYKIRNINYSSGDPDINNVLVSLKPSSLIKSGENYDKDILDKERDRVSAEIRDLGMYFFNKNYITYAPDSSLGSHEVDINLYVNRQYENSDPALNINHEPENHHRYKLNNIYLLTNYDPRKQITDVHLDTAFFNGHYYIYDHENEYVKKEALSRVLFVKQGEYFLQSNVDYTYNRLAGLNLFKFINFRFVEVARNDSQHEYLLNLYIQLSPLPKQEYKIESELTHNGGNLGVAGSVSYQNKNLFRGAETLELKISGGLEALRNFADTAQTKRLFFFNTYDIGPEISLGFKKFLLPGFIERKTSGFFNPKSILTTGFNYQERPDYIRLISKLSLGYQWRVSERQQFIWYPLEFNAINVTLDPAFSEKLSLTRDPNLIYSYSNHLIASHRVSWIYTNQAVTKGKNFFFLRANGETAGNVLYYIVSPSIKSDQDSSGRYSLFKNIYAQYFKPDVDFSYHQTLNQSNTLVYRVAGGIGFTYGNSRDLLLPFDKAFFAGGANDIRAWLARTLGPGSYSDPLNIEAGGDVKLEANVELRTSIFKILETAVFADAGNVWIRNDRTNSFLGSQFGSNFIDQVAIGGGFGLRFNFTFFIIRTDFAVKLRDPAKPNGHWVYPSEKFGIYDIVPNLAIGYPF